jgi:hypothetical protein
MGGDLIDGERQGKHYVQKFGTVPLQNVDRSFLWQTHGTRIIIIFKEEDMLWRALSPEYLASILQHGLCSPLLGPLHSPKWLHHHPSSLSA